MRLSPGRWRAAGAWGAGPGGALILQIPWSGRCPPALAPLGSGPPLQALWWNPEEEKLHVWRITGSGAGVTRCAKQTESSDQGSHALSSWEIVHLGTLTPGALGVHSDPAALAASTNNERILGTE